MALTTNIVAYWKLDESSGNAVDSTGNGFTLTNTNTVTYAAAKINNGAFFGAVNTDKVLSSTSGLGIDGGTMSITAWIYRDAAAGNTKWFFATFNSGSKVGYKFRYNSGIQAARDRVGTSEDLTTAQSISNDTWTFVAMTYDGTTVRCYVNAGTPQTVASSGNGSAGSGQQTGVGANTSDTGSYNNYWQGNVDEVGVWSRALSDSEITELYNAGAGLTYPFIATASPKLFTLLGVGT